MSQYYESDFESVKNSKKLYHDATLYQKLITLVSHTYTHTHADKPTTRLSKLLSKYTTFSISLQQKINKIKIFALNAHSCIFK